LKKKYLLACLIFLACLVTFVAALPLRLAVNGLVDELAATILPTKGSASRSAVTLLPLNAPPDDIS